MAQIRALDPDTLEVSSFATQSEPSASIPTITAACSLMWCDPYETVTICPAV
ncbi:MAG TPA: hypothetical protein VF665_14780 [Longimicrobium sp.]|jgi:hypothetical protein|uniref:hypothetical protein n=1 Tax=Longimicrobium sp. TaxID=2029185 RepID=UPI002ED7C172